MIKFDETVVIAVDFDGTLTERDNYPDIDRYEYNEKAIKWVLELRKLQGVALVLWTCSGNERVQAIRNEMMRLYGLWFDYANEYPHRGNSRKLNADIYVDDRANNGVIDWSGIYGKAIALIQQRGGTPWTENNLPDI